MTDIEIVSNQMNNEENHDLTRKIKRMKLNNLVLCSSPNHKSLTPFTLRDENIQKVFPFIQEEVI